MCDKGVCSKHVLWIDIIMCSKNVLKTTLLNVDFERMCVWVDAVCNKSFSMSRVVVKSVVFENLNL